MGRTVVGAALEDHRAAPLPEPLKATLSFLEKLTLTPADVNERDVADAVAAGVSPQALRDAIEVCAAFNVIDRVADALDFAAQSDASLRASTRHLISRGYA
jgi:alkylhydroperoxidase family enzyme